MKSSNKKKHKKPEHNFIDEYNEIMRIAGRDVATIEKEWKHNGYHIKKFSLLDNTPTPILTDHTSILNT